MIVIRTIKDTKWRQMCIQASRPEETRSPRFGSKHQLISLVSTLFILLVSDYVIKSIIYILFSGQAGSRIHSTDLCTNLSFDNAYFSFYKNNILRIFRSFYPSALFSIFCCFVWSDSDKIRCADINLSFDIFFVVGGLTTDKSNK